MTDGPVTPPPSPTPPPPPSPGPAGMGPQKSLVDRAKDILVAPAAEWQRIDAEPATIGGLFTSYVMILAAIPAVAMAIGLFLFMPRGVTVYGLYYGLSTGGIIAGAVLQYVMNLVGVYVVGLIIDALAPTFGSAKNQLQAMKVAAYYPTAAWVAGALMIVPQLGVVALLVGGIYSLYLLYLGLPILMKTPQDKQVGYFVVTLIAAIVVLALINTIVNRIIYGGMF